MEKEVGKVYILFTTDDDGNEIKVPGEYLGVNTEDVDCFRINNVITSLDEEEYYIYDPKDDMSVLKLENILHKLPGDKLISFEMDNGHGTNLKSIPGTLLHIQEDGDTIILTPEKVVEQEY